MIVFFIIFQFANSMSVNMKDICSCSKYSTETTCKEISNCKWKNKKCNEKLCTDYLSQSSCDAASNCAWSLTGCTTFTKCNDYYSNDPYDCFKKGDDAEEVWCQPIESDPGQCIDYQYTTCAEGKDEKSCQGFQTYWDLCSWDGNTCHTVDVRLCSELYSQDLCIVYGKNLGCSWTGSKCINYSCSDFKTENNCIAARQDNILDNVILCKWNSSTVETEQVCLEAKDTSHLTQDNCYSYTLYTHLWNTNTSTCMSCQQYPDFVPGDRLLLELGNYSIIINIMIILLIIY